MLLSSRTGVVLASIYLLSLVSAQNLDCRNILIDGQGFDISPLAGPYSVIHLYRTPAALGNITFTIDLCKPLDRSKLTDKVKGCPSGTRICGYERFYQDDTSGDPDPVDIWPVAGDFLHENRPLEPTFTRLKGSDSHADAEKEGIRILINGGISSEKVKQKAVIELLCEPGHTGLEGLPTITVGDDQRRATKAEDEEKASDTPLPDPNAGKPLQLISYKLESSGGKTPEEVGVLRLSWKTKYACEGKPTEEENPARSGSHWGFFTWFIIILFLVIAGYLIFGSWLNFSQHGARGWDLLPHGDTIRDVPYLLKDWARRVVNTVQGSGSNRGGYSSVG